MKKTFCFLLIFLLALGCLRRPEKTGLKPTPPPEKKGTLHETYVYGQSNFGSESPAALRVMVKGATSLTASVPVPGATVKVTLKTKERDYPLYEGKTGDSGEAPVRFSMPDLAPGKYSLLVSTSSPYGKEEVSQPIQVSRKEKILLVTDKPLYQPGQTIHIRALCLNEITLRPAAKKNLLLEVEDSKGNKVFKKRIKTGDYGLGYGTFILADEVNMGAYKIRALIGKEKTEKTVTVKKYVLPKFKVVLSTEKEYYLPGEKVKGKIQSDYFFGKAVSGGKVKIEASTYDVEFKKFATLEGTTDASGTFSFEFALPTHFVGQPLLQGNALLKLDGKITDKADHSEEKTITLPVAKDPVRIALIPEGGNLSPGVPNHIFVVTSYPDGRPASTRVQLKIKGKGKDPLEMSAQTDSAGIADFTFTPEDKDIIKNPNPWQWRKGRRGFLQVKLSSAYLSVTAEAVDSQGFKGTITQNLSTKAEKNSILLRSEKAIYQGGETLTLDILSTFQEGNVYVDIIKNRQTLLTETVELKKGRARLSLPASSDLFGTLECHAYKLKEDANFIRDTRIIYVQPSSKVKISVKADKDVYRPGEKAAITFQTLDKKGNPLPTALGITIVDEAVYALQEMQPGLEKVFFTLEKEISQPKYQIKYGPGESIQGLVTLRRIEKSRQRAARILFSKIGQLTKYDWKRNPQIERRAGIKGQLQRILKALLKHGEKNTLGAKKSDGSWSFKKGLLEEIQTAKGLTVQDITDPWGKVYSLDELAKTDSSFNFDVLAHLITNGKIAKAYQEIYNYWARNQKKNISSITLEETVLAGRLKEWDLVDGWGQKLRREKMSKPQGNAYYWQLRHVLIYSLGPDGILNTKDDVKFQYPYYLLNLLKQKHKGIQFLALQEAQRLQGEPLPPMAAMPERRFKRFDGAHRPGMAKEGADFAKKNTGERAMPQITTSESGATQSGSAAAPPRVREFFPETLLFQPRLITDEKGMARIDLDMADSITTWRLTASAHSKGGLLGGATAPIKVFQDFFVDIDFPVALTQNDEVEVPIAIFNYLGVPQKVKLVVQKDKDSWFELMDKDTKEVTMPAKEVGVVYFRLKAKKIGYQKLTVMAYGSKLSDAVRREVEILPDGKKFEEVFNGKLEKTIDHEITIPEGTIPDSYKIIAKSYPGIGAVLLEGVSGIMRMPHG